VARLWEEEAEDEERTLRQGVKRGCVLRAAPVSGFRWSRVPAANLGLPFTVAVSNSLSVSLSMRARISRDLIAVCRCAFAVSPSSP
jgi:hypothetical protein